MLGKTCKLHQPAGCIIVDMRSSRNPDIDWSRVRHVAALGEPLLELQPIGTDKIEVSIGGDVANSMLCLARILRDASPQLSIVTALGGSAYSAWLRKKLEAGGIRVIEPNVPGEPGIYGIPLDQKPQQPFSYWRRQSAAHHFLQAAGYEQFSKLIPLADLLVVTGITLALCSPESFEGLAQWVKIHGSRCQVVFDMNYRAALWVSADEARRRIAQFEKLTSVVATGVEDERSLWQMPSPEAITERLADLSAESVVRAGSDGCWVGSGSRWDHVSTTPVTVVDPVGAGDAHLAGYIGARITGYSVLEAADFANGVASTIVGQRGSAPREDTTFPPLRRVPKTGRSVP
jgi:2-dehydro-3-deoxygluconokinase